MQERFSSWLKRPVHLGPPVFVFHNLAEVKNYCDRAAIIREGQLTIDTIENLTRSQTKRVTIWNDEQAEPSTLQGTSSGVAGSFNGLAALDFLVEEPSLEELFYTIMRRWKRDLLLHEIKRKSKALLIWSITWFDLLWLYPTL